MKELSQSGMKSTRNNAKLIVNWQIRLCNDFVNVPVRYMLLATEFGLCLNPLVNGVGRNMDIK